MVEKPETTYSEKEEQEFYAGYNAGYLIAKYLPPEISKGLVTEGVGCRPYGTGFYFGAERYEFENAPQNYPEWMYPKWKRDHFEHYDQFLKDPKQDKTDKPKDKDKDMER